MKLLLAGDIGGTSTRLRLAPVDDWRSHSAEHTYPSQEYPDLVPVVQKFLTEMAVTAEVVAACFAVAGPVEAGVAQLQNLAWKLETDRLIQTLNIPNLCLINDFAAIGYGLEHLRPDELHVLQAGEPILAAPRAVIGAGTGLGQGYLVPEQGKYQVLASEGGHSDFAARSALEFELMQYLMQRDGLDHVSYDRLVSGRGIVTMYQFLRDFPSLRDVPRTETLRDRAAQPEELEAIATAVRKWEQTPLAEHPHLTDPAALIAAAAKDGTNALAKSVMDLFIGCYGAEAGNLALKFLPRGGLYLAGGIAAKNLPLLTDGHFMAAFSQKGRMRSLLGQIPVSIVLNPQVGLIGAAAQAVASLAT